MKLTIASLKDGAGLLLTWVEDGWDTRVRVAPGQGFRCFSYGDLTALGDGVHEIVAEGNAWSLPPPPPPPTPKKTEPEAAADVAPAFPHSPDPEELYDGSSDPD